MSLLKDDLNSHDQPATVKHELQKKSKISYTRDFLLSLSELDICKKLPRDADQSIFSELEDASQDRQRTSGGLSLNSFRRNEYGSSPPNRVETTISYARRIHGKREIHSSGRSDIDSDSQSDRDSVDSGWRYGDQSRWSRQGPEHDGLLGSGSFPRTSGYASGLSAPKVRANDHYQLNKSNEPYHPPRSYKALSHPRRDTDSFNNETFGSSEDTSEDRVEEEKKRRASFELMRKEQHKAFQESQKLNPVKKRDEFAIMMQLDESKDEKMLLNAGCSSDESITLPASKNDPETSFPSQTTVSRPLVPPGFTNSVLEKNSGTKSLVHSSLPEIGKDDVVGKRLQTKDVHLCNDGIPEHLMGKNSAEQMSCPEQLHGKTSISSSTNHTSENIIDLFSVDMPNKITGINVKSHENSFEVFSASENGSVADNKAEKVLVNTVIGEPSKVHSPSILEKLFGSALKLDGGTTNFIEHDNGTDDSCSPRNVQSSKFAHLFVDNDHRQDDDLSPKRSNDLLTLIVGGEKGGFDVSDVKHSEQSLPTVAYQGFESPSVTNSEPFHGKSRAEAVSSVLTCEAVEQSLLSKVSENDSALHQSFQGWSPSDADIKHPTAKSDDHASQHLLSLLQVGAAPLTVGYGDNGAYTGTALDTTKEENTRTVSNPGNTLTLETLFGSSFMQALQSVGAPVSIQRGSSESAKVDVSESRESTLPIMDDVLSKNDIGPNINHDHGVIASNQRQQNQSNILPRQWLNLNDPRAELDSSHPHARLGPKIGGYDRQAEASLPEEDSLIISDSMNFQNFMSIANSTKNQPLFHHTQDDSAAIFKPLFKDERPGMGGLEGRPFSASHCDRREAEIPHRNVHVHSSFSQLHPSQTNNVKLFHHLESHPPNMNSKVEFMLPEGMVHRDSPSNNQFVANMHRPPSTGVSRFDYSIPMMQQMQTSVNHPQHLLQGLPRGALLPITSRSAPVHPHSIRGSAAPTQPNNHTTGFMQEVNSMHGFHIGQHLPNYGGPGIPSPGGNIGNQPEAIQRHSIQMGQRSNPKQNHPLSASGHGQGMYGHELNMGYGYR